MVHVSLKTFKFPRHLLEQTRKLFLHGRCVTYNLVHLVLLRKFPLTHLFTQVTEPYTLAVSIYSPRLVLPDSLEMLVLMAAGPGIHMFTPLDTPYTG